jgi:hypothetical protein
MLAHGEHSIMCQCADALLSPPIAVPFDAIIYILPDLAEPPRIAERHRRPVLRDNFVEMLAPGSIMELASA